jgi:2-C-methyl-D-erythritol 4-phosphate cytidylyltransferase
LEKAYQTIAETAVEVTDEISAVERVGGQVMIVPNEEKNFKITVPADLPLAEFILRTRV